ncbi:MAG: RibD family protein [Pirellulales bacterium]
MDLVACVAGRRARTPRPRRRNHRGTPHGTARRSPTHRSTAGAATPLRIVLDTRATLADDSKLVRTAAEVPVLVVAGPQALLADRERLTSAGCEVLVCDAETHQGRINQLLDELGRRRMTNVLVEGGATLLGALFDSGQIDEVHTFIAPRLVGGAVAPSPLAGHGHERMSAAGRVRVESCEQIGDDVYLRGIVERD